ncbi:hypothetical protein [Mangrovibacterium diazotrophicum]|uniref:Outer membrane protein with beta-barrel domain n=1 Tax=Mangrovibacterium diazotrophicum TaxID=1261403 RepID=A0A419VWU8_9BACT|nr:hypothetical protein [Mangrovibacterium diazotrophicum]RKD87715.1 hypothetical protein BC643_3722 [Mangrovibacterium diazotrophicum]
MTEKNNMALTKTKIVRRSLIGIGGFTLSVFLLLMLPANAARAAETQGEELAAASPGLPSIPQRRSRTNLWSTDQYGQIYISAGLSEQFQYISFLGFRGAVDYQFSRRFSLGGQAAVYYGNSRFYKQRTPLIGIRGDYHLIRPRYFRRGQHLDVYMGVSGDVFFGAGKVKSKSETVSLKADAHLGARYQISKSLFLGAEIAYRYVYAGVTFEIP